MTFATILADVYRRTGYAASPASDVVTRIKAFVNETQAEILSEPGMEMLTHDLVTFASVASQQQYGLPPHVSRIKYIYETTNDMRLEPMSVGRYRLLYPDPSAGTGLPTHWVDLGVDSISVEPSDASAVFVDSTSASDTGSAFIEGVRTGGYPFIETITMNGTTAVSSVRTDIINITKFYISAAAVGTVTLVEDAEGGTELARIAIGQTYARRRKIALAPTPSSAITYTVDYEREWTDLIQDNDEPLIPQRFHRVLADGARAKEYEKLNQVDRLQVAASDYARGLSKLKHWAHEQTVGKPNLRPVGTGRRFDEHVQGAWIPRY